LLSAKFAILIITWTKSQPVNSSWCLSVCRLVWTAFKLFLFYVDIYKKPLAEVMRQCRLNI